MPCSRDEKKKKRKEEAVPETYNLMFQHMRVYI
jgi:hypothetical protein